jgi:amidase
MNELCTKGAGELAGMIASGAITSSEVIEAHLARIKEVNPDLNAATATLADEARAAAAAVDRSVAAGEQAGALAGVPFTVKENIDVARVGDDVGTRGLHRADRAD